MEDVFKLLEQAREEMKKLKEIRKTSEKVLKQLTRHAQKVKNQMLAGSIRDKAEALKEKIRAQKSLAKFAPVAIMTAIPGNANAASEKTPEELGKETAIEIAITEKAAKSDDTYEVTIEELNKKHTRSANVTSLKSIWDISAGRETANEPNPIGAVSKNGHYFGYVQYNRFYAENMVLFALLNDNYKDLGRKFMRPGYAGALKRFETEVQNKGNSAYCRGNKSQLAVKSFIKGETFKGIFSALGKDVQNKERFLQLQKDFGSVVYADIMGGNAKAIDKKLREHGMNLMQVDPAIIGMWLEHGIAVGNCREVIKSIKGNIKYINSAAYVDDYKKNKNIILVNADEVKKHLGKAHSLTTMREVSLMLNPALYQGYITKLSKEIQVEKKLEKLVDTASLSIKESLNKKVQQMAASHKIDPKFTEAFLAKQKNAKKRGR